MRRGGAKTWSRGEHLTRRGDFVAYPNQAPLLTAKGLALRRGHFRMEQSPCRPKLMRCKSSTQSPHPQWSGCRLTVMQNKEARSTDKRKVLEWDSSAQCSSQTWLAMERKSGAGKRRGGTPSKWNTTTATLTTGVVLSGERQKGGQRCALGVHWHSTLLDEQGKKVVHSGAREEIPSSPSEDTQ